MAWRGFKYDGVLHCLFQKQNPLQTIDLLAKEGDCLIGAHGGCEPPRPMLLSGALL